MSESQRKRLFNKPHFNLGSKRTESVKKMFSERVKNNPPKSRRVLNINTGEIYNTIKSVSIKYNIHYGNLIRKLSGRRRNNTCFKYLE